MTQEFKWVWNGYRGALLFVDLTKRNSIRKPLSQEFATQYIGGRGFGARLLYDEVQPNADPLSPENRIILATGPLTGTSAPGSKMSMIAKSPATGGYADSSLGGVFGPQLKFAGYDVVVVAGRSRKPIYLSIRNDEVEFCDATGLWGVTCSLAEEAIRKELGDARTAVATIGPAGERLVNFACVTHKGGRQAGRCGMGAVMGSKNLKGVAAWGNEQVSLADPVEFDKTVGEARRLLTENPSNFQKYGTAEHVTVSNEMGSLPTRNYSTGTFEGAETISGETMYETIVDGSRGCFACPVGCSKYSTVKDGPHKGTAVEGPEYETIAMLGSNCGIADIRTIAKANLLCDELGMDTISTGNVVGFAMECYQRGIIGKDDTDGLELEFGNEEAFLRVIELIGNREGLGQILSQGVRRAAESFGSESNRFAMHTKGLEWSAYECRGALGQALGYALVDRGADHNRIWCTDFFISPDKSSPQAMAELAFKHQRSRSACDLLGICRFISYQFSFDYYAKMMSQATGLETSADDIMNASERVFNLTRLYNMREGFTRKDDSVPMRCFVDQVPSGPTKGKLLDPERFNQALEAFYEISGWDKQTGAPLRNKLRDLALEEPS
ncbi:MAG TPA: aldehyde ferredoxin oxidoreductase family protein [Candidatus Dormibacteraeota bacterium]|nr:aldehyde ferredoxin oxidoreductase family protein [Candidatus Dormibacteraeota bacterium]